MVTWRRACAVSMVAGLALAQDAPQTDVLRGVVVDAAGVPVAGIAIDVCRRDGGDFTCLDLEFARELRKVTTVRTGKNGSFALQVPRGVPYELRGDDGVHAPIARQDVYGGEELRLVLEAAAAIVVKLVDKAGRPAGAGGNVRAWSAPGQMFAGTIDENGVWRSGRMPAGSWTVDIQVKGAMRPPWQMVDLVAGAERALDLTLEPGFVRRGGRYVSGTVKDDAEAPVAGMVVVLKGANADRPALLGRAAPFASDLLDANIVDHYIAARMARTDSLGRIHFANVAPGNYVMEWFRSRARDAAAIVVTADADPAPVAFTVPR